MSRIPGFGNGLLHVVLDLTNSTALKRQPVMHGFSGLRVCLSRAPRLPVGAPAPRVHKPHLSVSGSGCVELPEKEAIDVISSRQWTGNEEQPQEWCSDGRCPESGGKRCCVSHISGKPATPHLHRGYSSMTWKFQNRSMICPCGTRSTARRYSDDQHPHMTSMLRLAVGRVQGNSHQG